MTRHQNSIVWIDKDPNMCLVYLEHSKIKHFTWQEASLAGRLHSLLFCPDQTKKISPWMILVSDWLIHKKIFSSETIWLNWTIFDRKHLCKVLYQICSFHSGRTKNVAMAAIGDSCFWLADTYKKSSSETAWPNATIFHR